MLVIDPAATASAMGWIAGGQRVPDGWALPEGAFDHRDSMVTKAEVRALVLAHLAPRTGSVVWDLGSGSGSVAVECARFGADVGGRRQGRRRLRAHRGQRRRHTA